MNVSGTVPPEGSPARTVGPLDVLVAVETLRFLLSYLPEAPARVLEVGCGRGDLASLLMGEGYDVTAVDACADAVAHAGALGIDAHVANWPDFPADGSTVAPFDAILFSRSLHHIAPLDAALVRVEELLVPAGRLLVEDFAVERMEPDPIAWFRETARPLQERKLIADDEACLGVRLLRQDDALERWKAEHRDLLDAQTILAEIGRRFDLRHAEDAPYLFRFLAPALQGNVGGFDALVRFITKETHAIGDGRLTPVGRRYVALRRD